MFDTIQQRVRGNSAIKTLCMTAAQYANADGQKEPVAEHFVLAALESPDGTARKAFEHMGVDPSSFRAAIAQEHADHALAPAQTMVQLLANLQKANAGAPLLSAHVLVAVAAAQHGVALRVLKAMGVDPQALADAAAVEIGAATIYEI